MPTLRAAAEAGLRRAEIDSGRRTPQQQQQQQQQHEGTAAHQLDAQPAAAPQGLRARVQRLMSQQDHQQPHPQSAPEQVYQASHDPGNGLLPAAGHEPSLAPAAAVVVSSDDEAPSVGLSTSPGQVGSQSGMMLL
jgi:hypothetical protein